MKKIFYRQVVSKVSVFVSTLCKVLVSGFSTSWIYPFHGGMPLVKHVPAAVLTIPMVARTVLRCALRLHFFWKYLEL